MTTKVERKSNNLSDQEYKQVIEWIWGTRQGHANAVWFINTIKENATITNSNRGEFQGDKWYPTGNERQPCCEPIIDQITDEEPYGAIAHCQTKEHVENLVNSLNNREIRKEFNRMVKATAEALEESFDF